MPKQDIKIGDKVLYVPNYAQGDVKHPDCEAGVVTAINTQQADDAIIFVRFDGEVNSKSCYPQSLVVTQPSSISPNLASRTLPTYSGEYTFRGQTIPADAMKSLKVYVEIGRPVGSFLQAVLENDLIEAVAHADNENIHRLAAYIGWLFNESPEPCYGSKKKVKAWIDMGGLKGMQQAALARIETGE